MGDGKFKKGMIPWNKGKKGLKIGWSKGTKFSEEHKDKLSEVRKKMFKEGKIIHSRGMLGKESWNKGKKHLKISGENHWNWKGGITPLNKLLKSSSKWKIWRELVFLRDNFTCQNHDCKFCNNKIGVMLHPHHIKSLAIYPELVFKVDNGITYCKDFHIKSGLHKGIQKVKMQKEC